MKKREKAKRVYRYEVEVLLDGVYEHLVVYGGGVKVVDERLERHYGRGVAFAMRRAGYVDEAGVVRMPKEARDEG